MKKISTLILVCISLCTPSLSQPSWNVQDPPVQEDLVAVCFVDPYSGWIVSSEGSILSTTDGGFTWNTHSFPGHRFSGVHFSSLTHGCVVGWQVSPAESSVILMTSDGGNSWSLADHPTVKRLNGVFFHDDETGWAVGAYDNLDLNCCLSTYDGGQTWTHQDAVLVAGAELFSVHFRDSQLGVACGADGAFVNTSSGGSAGWAFNISMPLADLNSVWNSGTQHGCAVGDGGTVLYTINNWYQHIEQVAGTAVDLHGVHSPPGNQKYWAVGDAGTIVHTSNYILGWTIQESETTEDLFDVWMLSENKGWAVGSNGTLLKYATSTSVGPGTQELAVRLSPNPCGRKVCLYIADRTTLERIEVIDIFGQVRMTAFPAEAEGRYSIDLAGLQNGVYFLKLYTWKGFTLKRLVLNPR